MRIVLALVIAVGCEGGTGSAGDPSAAAIASCTTRKVADGGSVPSGCTVATAGTMNGCGAQPKPGYVVCCCDNGVTSTETDIPLDAGAE